VACLVRWPWYAAGDAAALDLAQAGAALAPGTPVWVCGNASEGLSAAGCAEALRQANSGHALKAANGVGGVGEGGRGGPALFEARATPVACGGGALLLATRVVGPATNREEEKVDLFLSRWRTKGTLALPLPPTCSTREVDGIGSAGGGGGTSGGGGGGERLPWVTYPGLFASGGLDVMTAALLEALPDLPPTRGLDCRERSFRVLDACCGSGAIAAALRHRHGLAAANAAAHAVAHAVAHGAAQGEQPGLEQEGVQSTLLELDLLDADALALEAARSNVPDAAAHILCAGWPDSPLPSLQQSSSEADAAATSVAERGGSGPSPGAKKRKRPLTTSAPEQPELPSVKRYDWIVSNPPVHRGQPDDFRVLEGLVAGARSKLRSRGVLWLVAQQQVPVGRILARHAGDFAWVRAAPSGCGRFVVWSAGRNGPGPT